MSAEVSWDISGPLTVLFEGTRLSRLREDGGEKNGIGSKPCSSRTLVSFSVILDSLW